MSELMYSDSVRMDAVLANTRHILAEAEQVARGEKVKITFYPEDGHGPVSACYPPRVADYARKMLGAPAPFPETTRLSFTFCGCTLVHLPTEDGYRAFVRAILARTRAEQRRASRALRKTLAQQRKGGPQA